MPKILNHPSASYEKASELATAVDSLGGNCELETAAEALGKKVSGGLMQVVSSAQKYELLEYSQGKLTVTETFKLIKFAYSDEERDQVKKKSFLSPPMFSELYERFKGRELPLKQLDKILIREYGVDEAAASRIAGYFVDGLKELKILDSNNILIQSPDSVIKDEKEEAMVYENKPAAALPYSTAHINTSAYELISEDGFTVHIYGPGLNNKIEIKEEEDLLIVEAVLKKIKKAMAAKAQT